MNCEEFNSEDNSRRRKDNSFNEYNDWMIPFKCNICQKGIVYAIHAIQKALRRIKGNVHFLR